MQFIVNAVVKIFHNICDQTILHPLISHSTLQSTLCDIHCWKCSLLSCCCYWQSQFWFYRVLNWKWPNFYNENLDQENLNQITWIKFAIVISYLTAPVWLHVNGNSKPWYIWSKPKELMIVCIHDLSESWFGLCKQHFKILNPLVMFIPLRHAPKLQNLEFFLIIKNQKLSHSIINQCINFNLSRYSIINKSGQLDKSPSSVEVYYK